MKKRAPSWAVAAKIPPGIRSGPRLWHLPDLSTFIWKYVFRNKSGAFYFFHGNVKLNVSIRFNQIKEKSIENSFLPLEVGKNFKLYFYSLLVSFLMMNSWLGFFNETSARTNFFPERKNPKTNCLRYWSSQKFFSLFICRKIATLHVHFSIFHCL